MARRRRSSSRHIVTTGEDYPYSSSRRLPRRSRLDLFEDRIIEASGLGDPSLLDVPSPYPVGPSKRFLRQQRARRLDQVQAAPYKPPALLLPQPVLVNPRRYSVCRQRQQRREVLHALKVAGRRGLTGRGGHYRRSDKSQYKCGG